MELSDDRTGIKDIQCIFEEESDWAKYLIYTSDIMHAANKDEQTHRAIICQSSLADKILAGGYIISAYMDPANTKAIIPMDASESKNNRSDGGTGKSLWLQSHKHTVPTVIIPGKNPKLFDNPHLYERVTERTQFIGFDDVRRAFDFESLLSDIKFGIIKNPKGTKSVFMGMKKFGISTNYVLRGDGNSFVRWFVTSIRQLLSSQREPVYII